MTIDMKKPVGSRITDLKVRCDQTIAPCIDSIKINDAVYENILPNKEYPVVGTTYLYNGGDGFKALKQSYRDRIQGKYFKLISIKLIYFIMLLLNIAFSFCLI